MTQDLSIKELTKMCHCHHHYLSTRKDTIKTLLGLRVVFPSLQILGLCPTMAGTSTSHIRGLEACSPFLS